MEQFYQDVMIDDFDANVAIQCSSNESCDEIGCVCQCLQAVKGNDQATVFYQGAIAPLPEPLDSSMSCITIARARCYLWSSMESVVQSTSNFRLNWYVPTTYWSSRGR